MARNTQTVRLAHLPLTKTERFAEALRVRGDSVCAGQHGRGRLLRMDTPATPHTTIRDAQASFTRALDTMAREHMHIALTRKRGNVTAAAKVMGISRHALIRLMRRLGVSRVAYRTKEAANG